MRCLAVFGLQELFAVRTGCIVGVNQALKFLTRITDFFLDECYLKRKCLRVAEQEQSLLVLSRQF
jgi:hypothetical protein